MHKHYPQQHQQIICKPLEVCQFVSKSAQFHVMILPGTTSLWCSSFVQSDSAAANSSSCKFYLHWIIYQLVVTVKLKWIVRSISDNHLYSILVINQLNWTWMVAAYWQTHGSAIWRIWLNVDMYQVYATARTDTKHPPLYWPLMQLSVTLYCPSTICYYAPPYQRQA